MARIKICMEEIDYTEEFELPINTVQLPDGVDSCLEGINSAIEDITTLQRLSKVIKTNTSIEALRITESMVNSIRSNSFIDKKDSKLSLESISLNDKNLFVLESISDAIRAIWEKIVATFKFIISKIVGIFTKSNDKQLTIETERTYRALKQKKTKLGSEESQTRKDMQLGGYLRFLKSTVSDKELTVKEIDIILSYFDSVISKFEAIITSADKDMGSAIDNLREEVYQSIGNDELAERGAIAGLIFSKIFKRSVLTKELDSMRDLTDPSVRRGIINSNADLEDADFKVIYDGFSTNYLIAKKIIWEGTYIKDVHSYKLMNVDVEGLYDYAGLEPVSLDQAIDLYNKLVDVINYRKSYVEKSLRTLQDIENSINEIDKRMKELNILDDNVANFVIGYVGGYKVCLSQLMKASVDLTNKLIGFKRLFEAIAHRFENAGK